MAVIVIDPKQVRPQGEHGTNTMPFTAGEDMTLGQTVYVSGDNTVSLTSAATADTISGRVGMVVVGNVNSLSTQIKAGERVGVMFFGPVYVGEDAELDVSAIYYFGDGDGEIEDAPGAVTRPAGSALAYNVLFFNPDLTDYN